VLNALRLYVVLPEGRHLLASSGSTCSIPYGLSPVHQLHKRGSHVCAANAHREAGREHLVLHGFAQITTQALRMCADEEIPVHLVTTSGAYLGGFFGASIGVQRRIRQYRGLCDEAFVLALCRRLIMGKVENQLQHLLRASRKDEAVRTSVEESLATIRLALSGLDKAADREAIMGHEGSAARAYFAALPALVEEAAGEDLKPDGRSRRPPVDRFNALLSFGYGLLYRDLVSAIVRVGLEPAFGMLHQPRTAALPLALDLMELFRVSVVDIAVLGAVNRRESWCPSCDGSGT
jgi:CRISPR-associated protein Cas1